MRISAKYMAEYHIFILLAEILSNSFLNLFYLSDAPHAVPHAAGFSSGLSAAPHAVPHAALVSVSAFFHPKRFDNAILLPPDKFLLYIIFVARL